MGHRVGKRGDEILEVMKVDGREESDVYMVRRGAIVDSFFRFRIG